MIIASHGSLGSLICKSVDTAIDKLIGDIWIVKAIAFWLVVLPLAFASHFVLDKIPHYDYSITDPNIGVGFILLAIDTLIWLLLLNGFNHNGTKYFAGPDGEKMIVAGLVAISPDIIVNLSKLLHLTLFSSFVAFHDHNHASIHPGAWLGMPLQIAVVALCCWGFWLLRKTKAV